MPNQTERETVWLRCDDTIAIVSETSDHYLIDTRELGYKDKYVWMPKSCVRITEGKTTIEIAELIVDKNDLWWMIAEEEHGHA